MEEFVCEPQNWDGLRDKVTECFRHLDDVKARLEETVPVIKEEAQSAFDMIKGIK